MSIKSKVFAATVTLTLVGGIGAAGAMSASAATTLTPVAVVNAMVVLVVVALFAAMSTGRRAGPLLFSTGRSDRSGGMGR